ncbi:MAG TPA: hypothetical protein VGV61_18090 [Thermoanaerobaculia bacterium]|jgi:hypothetical protein|nr:hypothetical protein [Thermoanaerobaculia bacterium]
MALLALLLAATLAPAAAGAPASAPPPPARIGPALARPTVSVRLAPAQVTVGDRVKVEIEVTMPPQARLGPPAIDPRLRQWGEAEVLASKPARAVAGAADRYRIDLEVTAFRTGDVRLPALPVAVAALRQGEEPPSPPILLATPPLAFRVRSVLPAQGVPTPQPPTPPQTLPLGAAFWWATGALGLACLLAAGALAWRRRGLAAPAAAAPALPPLDRFLRQLAALAADGSAERLHTGLSLALRQLLAGLLGFAAAERTTTEIDRELRSHRLATPTRRRLVELLRRCDEVKFARRPATAAEGRERLQEARALATEVDRQLLPPPAPAGETSGGAAA